MEWIKEVFEPYWDNVLTEEAKVIMHERMDAKSIALLDLNCWAEPEMMFFDTGLAFLQFVSTTYDCWGQELDSIYTYTLGEDGDFTNHYYFTTPIYDGTIETYTYLCPSTEGLHHELARAIVNRAETITEDSRALYFEEMYEAFYSSDGAFNRMLQSVDIPWRRYKGKHPNYSWDTSLYEKFAEAA